MIGGGAGGVAGGCSAAAEVEAPPAVPDFGRPFADLDSFSGADPGSDSKTNYTKYKN